MLDKEKKPINVGDRVAYSVLQYRTAILRIGEVVDIQNKQTHYNGVDYDHWRATIQPDLSIETGGARKVQKTPNEIVVL